MKENDIDKMYYLYFERMYSFEAIEKEFKGKYTYEQVKKICLSFVKTKRKN